MRRGLIALTILSLAGTLPLCVAQRVDPFIQLSPSETAKAKQLGAELKQAYERHEQARLGWGAYLNSIQALHPELSDVRFTSDFRIAFTKRTTDFGAHSGVKTVQLSSEERKKAEGLYTERREAEVAFKKAEAAWKDYGYELAGKYVPGPPGSPSGAFLSDSRWVSIAYPWANGVLFLSDFRIMVRESGN